MVVWHIVTLCNGDVQDGKQLEAVRMLANKKAWDRLQQLAASLDARKHADALRFAAAALAAGGQVQAAKECFLRLTDHQARHLLTNQ